MDNKFKIRQADYSNSASLAECIYKFMYCAPCTNTFDTEGTPDTKNREIIEYVRGACAVHDSVPYGNEFHGGLGGNRAKGIDIWEPPPP